MSNNNVKEDEMGMECSIVACMRRRGTLIGFWRESQKDVGH
jgi:hypothetical protein